MLQSDGTHILYQLVVLLDLLQSMIPRQSFNLEVKTQLMNQSRILKKKKKKKKFNLRRRFKSWTSPENQLTQESKQIHEPLTSRNISIWLTKNTSILATV